MGILEKLRPQPRWKHADPAVRAAAVYDLGPDDADALRALAREDADARVRRAAVNRVDDLAVLADVARTDPDQEVRSDAIRGLAGLAAEADDVARATDAVRHLSALGRMREVVVVARENRDPAIRAAVIDLIDEGKALGSISRHAADAQTRLRALARLSDPTEMLNVALKSEHTDTAVAALERLESSDALSAVAKGARNKVAGRRAKTKVRQLEEAAQPHHEPVVQMTADDAARGRVLLHRAESVVAIADPDEAARALADVRLEWAEFGADVDIEAGLVRQFDSASEAAREAIAERQQERAAEEERARAIAQEQADRLAIVSEIEELTGEAAPDRIAELRVQWDALPPMPSEYAASLNRRFQDASRAFEDRERRRLLAAAAAGRLETLATELEQLVASGQPVEEIIARWRGLRRDADVLHEHAAANPSAAERLERAVATLEEKEHEHQHVRVKQEQDNLRRLQQLCRQVEVLAAAEQVTLKAGDRALRDIRAALEQRVPLPSKKDRQDIHERLERARAAIGPRVQELRDADEWQRWANLTVQEELCREMETLKAEENPETASRRMRELQARWKEVALAPRTQGEAMWRRFKDAQDEIFKRTASFFAALQAERAANLTKKQALAERAEALAPSTDWVRTASQMQALQAEWKTIGPVSRGQEKAVWERFRGACDRFFTRRQDDLKRRKDEWASNLERKEALCAQAEALADSTDWNAAAAALKTLQAEWKTIGPVRKTKSEVVWQRFREACDRFFERFKHRDSLELQEKAKARDEVIRELEALLPYEGGPTDPPETLYKTIQDARARWQQAPELPRGVQQDLAARYHQALSRLVAAWPTGFSGTDLDPDTTRKRMEKLVTRVEEMAPEKGKAQGQLSPAELLAQQWRERLAANTMTGGKSAETDESRWRAAEQEVRNAQAQWARFGPLPAEIAAPLNERFQRACRRFYDSKPRMAKA